MNIPRAVFRNVLNTNPRNVFRERSERTLRGVPGNLGRGVAIKDTHTTLSSSQKLRVCCSK